MSAPARRGTDFYIGVVVCASFVRHYSVKRWMRPSQLRMLAPNQQQNAAARPTLLNPTVTTGVAPPVLSLARACVATWRKPWACDAQAAAPRSRQRILPGTNILPGPSTPNTLWRAAVLWWCFSCCLSADTACEQAAQGLLCCAGVTGLMWGFEVRTLFCHAITRQRDALPASSAALGALQA